RVALPRDRPAVVDVISTVAKSEPVAGNDRYAGGDAKQGVAPTSETGGRTRQRRGRREVWPAAARDNHLQPYRKGFVDCKSNAVEIHKDAGIDLELLRKDGERITLTRRQGNSGDRRQQQIAPNGGLTPDPRELREVGPADRLLGNAVLQRD